MAGSAGEGGNVLKTGADRGKPFGCQLKPVEQDQGLTAKAMEQFRREMGNPFLEAG